MATNINKINKIMIDGVEYQFKDDSAIDTVDSELNLTSENPIQNKAVAAALETKQPVGNYALKSEIPSIPTIDSTLSSTSENSVQNKIITAKFTEQSEAIQDINIVANNTSTSLTTLSNDITSGAVTAGNSQKLEGKTLSQIKNEISSEVGGGDSDSYASKAIYGDTAISLGRKPGTESGPTSIAFGVDAIASTYMAYSFGYKNNVTGGYGAVAFGSITTSSGYASFSEGSYTTASGQQSHAEGSNCIASGRNSHAEGGATTASADHSHSQGFNTSATNIASFSCGRYSKDMITGGQTTNQIGDVFIIGNGKFNAGPDTVTKSNALRVTYQGDILATKAFQSSGADYAEFIKPWHDNNPDNEDRVGYFVTIKNKLLYKANEGDYIVGITSGNPSIIGNADEDYYWRYERDNFNRIVMEDVPEMTQKLDDNGEPLYDEETHEPILVPTGKVIKNAAMKIADDYDSSQQDSYIERKYRPEWDYVGMIGVIPVRDDGTCYEGGFCKCGQNGIATYASPNENNIFFVIERITDNIISVELR